MESNKLGLFVRQVPVLKGRYNIAKGFIPSLNSVILSSPEGTQQILNRSSLQDLKIQILCDGFHPSLEYLVLSGRLALETIYF